MKTCAILLSLLLLISSSSRAESDIHDEIAALKARIESLKEELASVETVKDAADSAGENVEKRLPEMEREIAGIARLRDIYRSAYRVVSKIPSGTNLGTLSLKDGSVIENAVLSGVSSRGLAVQSPTGPKTLAPDLLPDALRAKFTFVSEPEGTGFYSEDFTRLRSARPDFLEAEETETPVSGGNQSNPPTMAKTREPSQSEVRQQELEATLERNNARMRRIEELKAQFTLVSTRKVQIIRERAAKKAELRQTKIKKSAHELDKIFELYENRIRSIEIEEDKLRAEIERVRNTLE